MSRFIRALKAGVQRPLLVCPPHNAYEENILAAVLGALQALYLVSAVFLLSSCYGNVISVCVCVFKKEYSFLVVMFISWCVCVCVC